MITKTLGGDRLGSGKKMKVELHGYERSTHDLGYLWRSTMSSGTLIPFMKYVALPGDTFDIELNADIKTHPTIGPLFGSYKVQLDVFTAPFRLYIAELHNNRLGVGMNMAAVKLPKLEFLATEQGTEITQLDNTQVNPSSILAYLGVRGIGTNLSGENQFRQFNGLPLLAYWDIYKNYYANKQEEQGAVIHTEIPAMVQTITGVEAKASIAASTMPIEEQSDPLAPPITMLNSGRIFIGYTGAVPIPSQIMFNTEDGQRKSLEQLMVPGSRINLGLGLDQYSYDSATNGYLTLVSWQYRQQWEISVVPPEVTLFPLTNIDLMKDEILQNPVGTEFIINNNPALTPYWWIGGTATGDIPFIMSSQEGLGIKTYQSDLFNNWLQTEWIDGVGGISEVTAIDTSGGSFTIDTLNLSKKVYDMLNRIAVSGGSYDDWLDSVYDHERRTRSENPVYQGGLIKELVFQEVVSNSSAESNEGGGQPLGTLAGKGVMSSKHKGGKIVIKVDEPCYIIGIVSLTPRVDYSQGNEWDMHLDTMDDLHKPALDEIGFQELITEQMAWWSTTWNVGTSSWEQKSAGKQPAWLNYMTAVNKTYGNFAIPDNEMFMTLNRRYETEDGANITDLTTYIDPVKFNQIFAQTALDAQNFWTQISVDCIARRKMSAKLMPNL